MRREKRLTRYPKVAMRISKRNQTPKTSIRTGVCVAKFSSASSAFDYCAVPYPPFSPTWVSEDNPRNCMPSSLDQGTVPLESELPFKRSGPPPLREGGPAEGPLDLPAEPERVGEHEESLLEECPDTATESQTAAPSFSGWAACTFSWPRVTGKPIPMPQGSNLFK